MNLKGKEEIEELPDSTRIAKSGFYDLQGRRVQGAPQKGVYIRHGRKFMKKATKRQ